MALVPGSNAGPYRIIEPLGRGGMASVYKAYEPKLDRYVALKVLPREFLHDPSFAQRFRQEAQALALLEHPNIVPIYNYDIDEHEGIPWMAMRLVSGGALSQLLRGEGERVRLPPARVVEILRGVADALDYAHTHAKRIVHRDVKPQNVLLDQGGRVYLADFGIAKILESSGGLTATGMITGTPQYMAPEQATGTKVGPAADVYALGIVAYEMLAGHVPFAADTPVAIMMKHVQEPLPLPPPDRVPEPLLRAILKCTAKKPEDRWPSAGAFVSALEAGLEARTVPALADVPTLAVPRAAAPTVVSPRTAVPAPTAPPSTGATRPAGAVTRPAPPPQPLVSRPATVEPAGASPRAGPGSARRDRRGLRPRPGRGRRRGGARAARRRGESARGVAFAHARRRGHTAAASRGDTDARDTAGPPAPTPTPTADAGDAQRDAGARDTRSRSGHASSRRGPDTGAHPHPGARAPRRSRRAHGRPRGPAPRLRAGRR